MVVMPHADPSDIAIRDPYGSFRGFAPNPNGLGPFSVSATMTSREFCTTYHVSPQLVSWIVSVADGWPPRLLCGRTVWS